MKALEGADVTIKNWKPKKYGEGRVRCLDTYDLALLLTIASRQCDEWNVEENGPDPNADNYICYGGEGLLSQITRMGTTKLEDCRDFLVAANLISYTKGAKCPKYLYPTLKTEKIDYVWKLNKTVLWNLARQSIEPVVSPPHKEGEPATQGRPPRHAGTKSTYQTTSNSSKHAVADNGVEDRKRAKLYIDRIAQKYNLTDEQKRQIGIEGILSGTKGKMPDDVFKAIDEFGQRDMIENKYGQWVGMFVNRLKGVTEAADPSAIKSAEEMEAQFTEAKRVDERARRREAATALWCELSRKLELNSLPDEGGELSAALVNCLKAHREDFDATIAKIRDNLLVSIGCLTFTEFREAFSDVKDRAEKLMAVLTNLTPKSGV